MGNTSIQTQSYRAVDKDAGQSRSYIIPFALLCSLTTFYYLNSSKLLR